MPQLPPPPAELAVFEKDLGTWDAEVEVRPWPGAEPQRSKGVTVNRMACGGRWMISDYTADSGFEGHGVYGWDTAKQRYTGVWVDTMRSIQTIAEGTWDAETRTMTMRTLIAIPGRAAFELREETQTIEPGLQVFRSFMPGPDGREFEMMTVTYRRRAG